MERCSACEVSVPRDLAFCPSCGAYQDETASWTPAGARATGSRLPAVAAIVVPLVAATVVSTLGWLGAASARERDALAMEAMRAQLVDAEAELQEQAGMLRQLSFEVDERIDCLEGMERSSQTAAQLVHDLLAAYEDTGQGGEVGTSRQNRELALLAIIDSYYQGFRSAWYRSYANANQWIAAGNEQADAAREWKARHDGHRQSLDQRVAEVAVRLSELEARLAVGCPIATSN